jgi:streptogramin lyase
VVQYPLPSGSSGPGQITSDHSGRIWFVEQGSNQIGSYDPTSKSFSEFPIPTQNALPEGIAVDPAGNVWFAELTPNGLGMLRPENGTIKEITIPPAPDGVGCGPIGVTPQGNGSIWVTCEFSNQIDEYVPSLGVLKQFDLPVAFSAPLQVLFERSGNFWFTAADSGMLGYATMDLLRPGTTDGIEEFAPLNSTYLTTIVNPLLPSGKVVTSLAVPSQIAFSPDGTSLWVSEHGGGSFDRYDIGSRTLTKYFTSTPSSTLYSQSLPNGIAVDSSGNVWVAEHYGNRIAEFDPLTGSMVEYPVPCCQAEIAGVLYLALGTNGTVWFTENFGNAIGELSPRGTTVPIAIILQPDSVTLGTSGTATVSLAVSRLGEGTGSISFEADGISRNGALANLSATFDPGTLAPGTGGTETLSLRSSGLSPGIYYVTIGGASSTGLISSAILVVTVNQGFQYWWAIAAVVIALVVVALFAIGRRTKFGRKRHGTSVLQERPVMPLTQQGQEQGTPRAPPSLR